jgi:hypothetical protein
VPPRPYYCLCCGNRFSDYGNNPWPLNQHPEHRSRRCCDECNHLYVIPVRLALKGYQAGLDDGLVVQLYNADGSLSRVKYTLPPKEEKGR